LFEVVFYVADEESGGDEGETANAKEGCKVPDDHGERRRRREVRQKG